MQQIARNLVFSFLFPAIFGRNGHHWPNGYNRISRSHTWSYSPMNQGNTFQNQPGQNSYSYAPTFQSSPPMSTYSRGSSSFANPQQQSQPRYSAQQSPMYPTQSQALPKSRSFSSPRNSIYKSNRPRLSVQGDRFPSYADRCGNCKGQPRSEVCGSDGKTYKNSCELQYISCKKYWDIREVSKGSCSSECPGVSLGMYTGWGLSRASNNGYCHHDFFRCCKAARKAGLPNNQIRSCCQARADKCFAFVAEKPWRSGIVKYGK